MPALQTSSQTVLAAFRAGTATGATATDAMALGMLWSTPADSCSESGTAAARTERAARGVAPQRRTLARRGAGDCCALGRPTQATCGASIAANRTDIVAGGAALVYILPA
jgi:hypothetical protein